MAKILLVEDDKMMAGVYEKAFRLDGHEVGLAANGVEGLEKLEESLPNIILLDIMMPKMNGMEFLEKIKSDTKTKDIPVVVLTNLAGKSDAEFALSKGATEHIVKSRQDPQKVVETVNKILITDKSATSAK